ncbi:MAG: hypothetical protein ACT4P7_11305 [Gemmatimonadaceae bacterium]
MHTLIIMQNDAKVRRLLPREDNIEFGIPGSPIRYRLQIFAPDTPAATAALGGTGGALGATFLDSANRIKRKIIAFADSISNPPITVDVVEFQVIFLFHQTSRGTARAITRGLNLLDADPQWRNLPERKRIGIRVRRSWLLSCESGTDQAVADTPNIDPALARKLQQWVQQARDMRIAAAVAFTTEQKPPPSDPKRYWVPFIYTFSTGDPVTGGITLDPQRVGFRVTPYTIDDNGNFQKIPKPAGSTQSDDQYEAGTPTVGKVYKYEGQTKVDEKSIVLNSTVNILTGSF